MQDSPDPEVLLAAVSRFLRERALPQLDAHTAFHARVAANVLDIVARQWLARPRDEPAEAARLERLLASMSASSSTAPSPMPAGSVAIGAAPAAEGEPLRGAAPVSAGGSESPISAASHLAALNRRLCTEIAAGRLGLDSPELIEHLWLTTLAKLAVDQPRYETYRRLQGDPDRSST